MPPRVTTDPLGARKTNCAAWLDSKVCSDVTVTAHGSATREVLRNSEETVPSFRASDCAMLAVPQGLSDAVLALSDPEQRMCWPDSKQAVKKSPKLAPLRHADCIEQCPLSGVTRKTFARTEFFSVCAIPDITPAYWQPVAVRAVPCLSEIGKAPTICNEAQAP